MVALETTGALSWVQFARYLLAQALAKAGQFREAAQLVDQTLAALASTSGRWCEAELHRLRGDLLLRCDEFAAAEACYEDAIAVELTCLMKTLANTDIVTSLVLLHGPEMFQQSRVIR